MNFDDIKKTMEEEQNDLHIPLSVKDIKSSHSPLKKIKNRLTIEVFLTISVVVLMTFAPLFRPMHASAQILYNLTMFNVIMVFFGWILYEIRLIRGLGIYNLTSRQSIEMFIIKIKSRIEVGKYFGFGIFAAMCLPLIIINVGDVLMPESYTHKYLYLNIPMWQITSIIAGILLFSLLGIIVNTKTYNKLYYKQLQILENIIRQF